MDDTTDIYADLITFDEKSDEKCKQCLELETQIVNLTKKVTDLEKVNKILEVNVSSLLLTARGEVSRKDRMIADLRRKLDDASFRRGNFKRHENYKSNSTGRGSYTENVAGNGAIYNPNVPPPLFPEDIKANIQTPLPEEFNPYISPPIPVDYKIKIPPQLPETVDTSEYTCTTNSYYKEEEDTEQKYEPQKVVDTIFSKRLRKKLQDEEAQRKITEKENAEKIHNDEVEKKEEKKLQLSEKTETNVKPCVSGTTKENSPKCNLDNKENLTSSNKIITNPDILVPSLKEEIFSTNEPNLLNKFSSKRPHGDYDEEVNTKRPKVEQLKEYDNFREDWHNNGTEFASNSNTNNEDNLEKLNEFKEEEQRSKKLIKEEADNSFTSRLYLISEDSGHPSQKRRDTNKRKEDWKQRFKDWEKYDNDRHEKFNHEDRYEREKYKKFDKERFERDQYRDRAEFSRFERDKYDNYKYGKDKFEKDKYKHEMKFDRNSYEREKYEREQFEKNKPYNKRFRRSQSSSPERNHHNRHKVFRKNECKDNFGNHNQRNSRFRNENWGQDSHRSNEQESKFILEDYQSRKETNITKSSPYGRSRSSSNTKGRRGEKFDKCRSKSARRRNNQNDEAHQNNPEKKISLDNYRARRDGKSIKNDTSERGTSSSKDEDSRDSKTYSRQSKDKDNLKIDLGSERLKLAEILEKSEPKEDLEEGEISNSFSDLTPCLPIHKNEEKKKSSDIVETKIKDLENNDEHKVENLKIKEDREEIKSSIPENSIRVVDKVCNKVSDSEIKKNIILVTPDMTKKIENSKEEKIETVSEKEAKEIPVTSNKNDTNQVPENKPKTKLNSELVNNSEKSMKNNIKKSVQSLDLFGESPEKILGVNKEGNKIEKISRNDKKEQKKIQEETKIEQKEKIEIETEKEDTNKMQKLSKLKREDLSKMPKISKLQKDTSEIPKIYKLKVEVASEMQKLSKLPREDLNEMKISKLKVEVTSPGKGKKQHKKTESKEKTEGEKVLSPSKEKKIKIKGKENQDDKVQIPMEELNPSELKKEDTSPKISNEVKISNQPEMQPRVIIDVMTTITSNISSSVKERRKQIKESKKQIEVPPKPKEEVKPKESKKPVQKVSEIKPRAKKTEEIPKKKVIIVVKRKRPVVLSDSNASTTIIANENVIRNIKLNNSGDKNLLS